MKIYLVTRGQYSDYSIMAVFSTEAEAQAFIDHPVTSQGGEIEARELIEKLPAPERWFVIEHMNARPGVRRFDRLYWPWDGPHYVGERRKSWNYSKWEYGERAWGMDEGAVEKAWKEQHAAREAQEAGI